MVRRAGALHRLNTAHLFGEPMQHFLRITFCLALLVAPAAAQQGSADPRPTSLAQQAIAGKATRPVDSADPNVEGKSLADIARQMQGKELARVKVSPEEAGKILGSVQSILRFASDDSGFTIRSTVKPRMISRNDVQATFESHKVDDEEARRLQASEFTLRKFGYVPRTFSTAKFVAKMYEEEVAGFYDPRTKMISLLNWVAPDEQRGVLAHELTHALQDQNFNLTAWGRAGTPRNSGPGRFEVSAAEARAEDEARVAVIEGQAMIVLIDHVWKEHGIDDNLASIPGVSAIASQYMEIVPVPDTPVIHASPVFLRDSLAFPYREGLVFELQLLEKGGRELAFNGPFARPPVDTHEILHPERYLAQEKIHVPRIPDLSGILGDSYQVVDSGGLGELDTRSLVKQFATSKVAETIGDGWRGSAYLLVRRKDVPIEKATTADLALIYVSAWDNPETAHQFAKFYAEAVPKRYSQAMPLPDSCRSDCSPESFLFNTEEGFVSIQRRLKNLVLVTESFDPGLSVLLDSALLKADSSRQPADNRLPELSLRYIGSPAFAGLRAMYEQWAILQALKLAPK